MKDYKQYNSTVKSVQVACEQASGDYHLSDGDLQALKYALDDLLSLYNTRSSPDNALQISNAVQ